jgi:hypothetical protein
VLAANRDLLLTSFPPRLSCALHEKDRRFETFALLMGDSLLVQWCPRSSGQRSGPWLWGPVRAQHRAAASRLCGGPGRSRVTIATACGHGCFCKSVKLMVVWPSLSGPAGSVLKLRTAAVLCFWELGTGPRSWDRRHRNFHSSWLLI